MGFNNYIDETNMIGLGIRCDNCGITTKGATYVNGMYFCAKCYQDTFGGKVVNVTIDKKIIVDALEQENKRLNEENKILKKALELAIETMNYEIGADAIINLYKLAMKNLKENLPNAKVNEKVWDFYIEQAKESLNEQV